MAIPFLRITAQTVKKGVKAGIFCVGSPETCARLVQRYVDFDVDQMILVAQLGYMSNDVIKDSLRLFANRVAPRFTDAAQHAQTSAAALP
jgi:alkanesulfonate monooxygenase SsuD/methylene tetrahydromethanopterin reductase-like flavin-dependent oxidoreductase (luciferase family)